MFSNYAMSGEGDDAQEPGSRIFRKKVIITVVLVVVISIAGYYGVSVYEQGVVQTSVVTGKITLIQLPSSGPGVGAAGAMGNPGALGVAEGGGGSYGLAYVTVSVPSGSFIQAFSCSTLSYSVGQTVKVADQLLRNGQHVYAPDIACRGTVSPFKSLQLTTTTTSSST